MDGRYTYLHEDGGQCAVSEEGPTTAEWRVDLGGVRIIHYIFIQYLTSDEVWGIVSFRIIHSI